ncbi:MAG TPA: FtsX-like permease family protein [Ktedonobacterales bacterium]|nr:FtsX-like permease family protein [Ktedonobacterales bacterium]
MKTRMYWSYATRSLARGGQRSLLAIFCVAVGVMAIVSLQLVGNAIDTALTGDIRALNGGDLSIADTTTPLTVNQLATFDTLQSQGALTTYTAVDSLSGQTRTATGARRFFTVDAVDPARFPLAGTADFTDPRDASLASVLHDISDSGNGDTVAITTTLAHMLGVQRGDTLHATMQDGRAANITVAGIIQDAGLFKGNVMLFDSRAYAALPAAGGQPLTYDQIYADVPGHTDGNAAHAESLIQAQFPLATVQTTARATAGNRTQVQQVQYFLRIVALLALLIGGVGIVNTMQVLLRRRRIEIAMLKTTGYRRADLYALFGMEAGLIGLAGGLVGTAAGVAVSFLVKGLVENSLQVALDATVDVRTLVAGVAVGLVTALIFGLLPIAKAGQVRPQAVLRELPEGAGWRSRILSGALLALLAALFFALAVGILGNVAVAALAVGGAGLFLGLLSLFLGLVVLVISRLPVFESPRWWYALPAVVALTAGIALTLAIPAFGALCLAIILAGVAAALLPRTWKANVKLALRNIGRQKARTITTLLALYIGVFSVGLILVLGQNISDTLSSFLASGNGVNAEIIAGGADRQAVDRELVALGVTHVSVAPFTRAVPVAVNGRLIADFVRAATSGGAHTPSDVTSPLAGAQGYDLAHGTLPAATDVPLAQGAHDASLGHTLTAADAGTRDALLPVAASQAPDNLKLGDTIMLAGPSGSAPITLTIAGFYSSKLPQFAPILTDAPVVSALSAASPQYGYALRLDPRTADATLATIQDAVPSATTFSLSDFVGQFAAQLNSLITVLVAVTSLALLASILIIANAVALAMLERRRELGILKAVGHTSRSVLGEVLVENGVIGFTAALLAMLVVAAAAALLGKLAFNLPLAIPTPTVLLVVAATAAVCMIVAAAVAWGAARVRPLEVLRYE